MDINELNRRVCDANLMLQRHGLVLFTWGNVSGIDRDGGLMVIKPSGKEYDGMTPEDMVAVDLNSGARTGGGNYRPSSDTPTHIALYKAFPGIGGIAHTHSRWAVIFAQLGLEIPALGTTHADHFYGTVPCTREMTADEILGEYEKETGNVIIERFAVLDPTTIPAVLVHGHGPFVWGGTPEEAMHNSVVLEEIAMTAWHCLSVNPKIKPIRQELLDRHYLRKNGLNAYYGQK